LVQPTLIEPEELLTGRPPGDTLSFIDADPGDSTTKANVFKRSQRIGPQRQGRPRLRHGRGPLDHFDADAHPVQCYCRRQSGNPRPDDQHFGLRRLGHG
jgi:hypothetical protein